MMTDAGEVLSALVDGEVVDADAVATALEMPTNRALLVDFVRLRGPVRDDDDAAPQWRSDDVVARAVRPTRPPRAWLRAAAVVALVGAGALGGTWVHGFVTRDRPPEPSRVVQLELVQSR